MTSSRLERCERNLEEEKEDGKVKVQEAEDKCEEDTNELTRVKDKENQKLEEKAGELGDLVSACEDTLDFHKQQAKDYKEELDQCRDNAECDGPDSVTLREQVRDEEEYIR